MACGLTVAAPAQLELVPDKQPQAVFAGEARNIALVWRNAGETVVDAQISAHILQTSSATTAPLSEVPWKKLQMLSGQTVLETANFNFPGVNAQTEFLVLWLADTNQVVGKTEVLVYPTNLLHELIPMLGGEFLGVLEPNSVLKPLLKQNGVEFLDLAETPLEDFTGVLAIIGPFESKTQVRGGLAQAIKKIAKDGAAVVWIQPPSDTNQLMEPSYYVIPEGKGDVVVVQFSLVADLAVNPISQKNLIYFCKLALNPVPMQLPGIETSTIRYKLP